MRSIQTTRCGLSLSVHKQFLLLKKAGRLCSKTNWNLHTAKQVFEVVVKEYGDMTTKEALEANVDKEIIDAKPDILLWEPFILNNNGVIEIEDTLQQIDTIIQNIQSALPDVTVMLQPPHPIYNATYYPTQVEELKTFAREKGYTYLDHWKAWPDYKSEELNDVVNENTDLPNERGHQLWADFLIGYFIAK